MTKQLNFSVPEEKIDVLALAKGGFRKCLTPFELRHEISSKRAGKSLIMGKYA